jgi:hypothetical protein
MAGSGDDVEIEFQCEKCGATHRKTLDWMDDHDELTCACGTMIPVDAREYHKERVKEESTRDGVQGLLEKLGK